MSILPYARKDHPNFLSWVTSPEQVWLQVTCWGCQPRTPFGASTMQTLASCVFEGQVGTT